MRTCLSLLQRDDGADLGLGPVTLEIRREPGHKTPIDVLAPALAAFDGAAEQGGGFAACLRAMKAASSLAATRTMVARLGRTARLSERSGSSLDAGAASRNLSPDTLADGLLRYLEPAT